MSTFKAKVVNRHAVHFKILEYDMNGRLPKAVYAGVIDDGTFDWKNIAYTYTPKSRMLLIYSSRSDIDIQQISLTKHYLGKKMLECTSIG